MDDYQAFLARKAVRAASVGFEVSPDHLPPIMKPFQTDLTALALRRGRSALFEGTGLGKGLQSLAWAQAVQRETRKPVLMLEPLAVAEQLVTEAQKFDIDGVAYADDRATATTPIVITNYDRIHRFDFAAYGGVVLGESSCLKSEDSKLRAELTERCADIPYRLCESATPAPNDWTELGQHAEFLGVMRAKEMLAMYFVHDGSVRAGASGDTGGWRLKRHAEPDFWAWVASWAAMVRHPRDLGYDEPGYDLPPLTLHQVTVAADYGPSNGMLFPLAASSLSERISVRRGSISDRVAAVVELVNTAPEEPWLIWCNMNAEADAIERALPHVRQVKGADSRALKKERLLGFVEGTPLQLCSKPGIAGHGMNYQHCQRMAFVGLNDSFEQLYQSVRRCWRFGQTKPVEAWLIASELEGAVVANLKEKERKFEAMADAMVGHTRALTRAATRGWAPQPTTYQPEQKMRTPAWLTA